MSTYDTNEKAVVYIIPFWNYIRKNAYNVVIIFHIFMLKKRKLVI